MPQRGWIDLRELACQLTERIQEGWDVGRLVHPTITEVIADSKGNNSTLAVKTLEFEFFELQFRKVRDQCVFQGRRD